MSVWDALIGQDHVVTELRETLASPGAMTHAWLFTGPPGSGRSVAATAFAAALQCRNEPRGCGECDSCRQVLAGTHPDVTRVTTEKVVIAMEEVRGLIQVAQRAPSAGGWRIILVEDADRMLERTSNVLLKSIEEPPERTIWLLCAPSTEDVIMTIRSRCRHVGLRIPPVEAIANLLATRDGIDEDVARAAARAAQCHVGMARRLATDDAARSRRLTILQLPLNIRSVPDAVIAAARLVDLAKDDAAAATEDRDRIEREKLLRDLGVEDGTTRLPPAVRSRVKQLEEDQKRRATRFQRDVLDRIMVDLLSLYRDVVVTQLGASTALINADLKGDIERIAHGGTLAGSVQRMAAVEDARRRLAANVAPLLAVEAMLVAIRPQA
ncbi:DNA polymerase III subunit delta' [Bowdeniella nasicola]|uniref:DNA polymerase III subunit delta n=1 Tax=Bowdeniella nasicola TaxID=208480 RepID=A0A1Q5Q1B8_9ACTO|nr:DNA polymerase III subunit delta' [Bowdeniella nasicola]OKL53663.1 DNA polymerase III subunit delta' [Bowdeniella nasicola]